MIKLTNINKYFFKGKSKENHVLNNINLEFNKNELVLITGKSGCGKTTLLNTIGLMDTFSGTITIDNDKFSSYSKKKMDYIRNHKVAYIFQNYSLIADLSVKDNLLIKLNLAGYFDKNENDILITKALNLVGLNDYENRLVKFLSGGQKQRVGIARAIIFNPDVILADEPTGNLDLNNSLALMKILKAISKEKLVILVSHEKELAKSFCSRIIELSDGKVISDKKNELVVLNTLDNNIYLGDMDKIELKSKDIKIDFYSQDSIFSPSFIFYKQNDTIYIKEQSNTKIKLVQNFDHINLVEAKKQVIEDVPISEESFDLDFSTNQKKAKRETVSTAKTALSALKRVFLNRRFFGKVFLIFVFIVGIATEFIISSFSATLKDFDKTKKFDDNHLALVSKKTDYNMSLHHFKALKKLKHFKRALKAGNMMKSNTYITFNISSYDDIDSWQAKDVVLTGHLRKINNEALLIGRHPQNNNEIVLSSVIADQIIKYSKTTPLKYYLDYNDVLTSSAKISLNNIEDVNIKEYKIVGITSNYSPYLYFFTEEEIDLIIKTEHTNETNLIVNDHKYEEQKNKDIEIKDQYINKLSLLKDVANVEFYDLDNKKISYDQISLQDNDVLVRKSFHKANKSIDMFKSNKFAIETTKDGSSGMDFIEYQIKGYYEIKTTDKGLIKNNKTFGLLMSDNGYSEYSLFNDYNKDSQDMFSDNNRIADLKTRRSYVYKFAYFYESSNPQADILDFSSTELSSDFYLVNPNLYRKAIFLKSNLIMQIGFIGRLIILFIFIIVALFFIIRSSTITRAKEIMTYRLIGLSPQEIKKTFILETLTYYLLAYLPGVLLSSSLVIIYNIRSPYVKYFISYTPWLSALVHLFTLAVFLLIGLIPVSRLLRKTPASLQAKYEL